MEYFVIHARRSLKGMLLSNETINVFLDFYAERFHRNYIEFKLFFIFLLCVIELFFSKFVPLTIFF